METVVAIGSVESSKNANARCSTPHTKDHPKTEKVLVGQSSKTCDWCHVEVGDPLQSEATCTLA